MRFLCDRMLERLARLLRAAGHDTAMAEPGQPDALILARLEQEARTLITRDRRLAVRTGAGAILITADRPLDQARELARVAPIDWTFAPFSRCMMDNARLRTANAEEIARMPADARERPGPFCVCPACGRLYWPGSHVKRLSARLHELARIGRQA